MKTSKIVPGVHTVLRGFVQAYVIESDDGLVLVDCGVPKSADRIEAAIRDMGRNARDISHILVTHHHDDHIGSLAEMARRTGAEVHVHAEDAAVTRGEEPLTYPTPRHRPMRAARRLLGGPSELTPLPEDTRVSELSDDRTLALAGGIQVVHTPGHTAGHVSFLLEREPRTLIVGDAAMNFLRLQPAAGTLAELFTADHAAARRSFRRLATLDFEAAVFGHGTPITSGASDRFRRAVRRRVHVR